MAVIKVADIAWARLRSPDVDRQEEFLLDFGMVRSDRTNKALYMRGTDPSHHLHITEQGDPAFIGHAYYAQSEEDLHKISRVEGASSIEEIDEPGGGKRVRLKDPDGFQVEIVWGVEKVDSLPVRPHLTNRGSDRFRRVGEFYRPSNVPAQVKRMGHSVIMTSDIRKTLKWYRENFGFVSSDDVYAGPKENIVGSFNRLDHGDEYVDHHVFFCWQGSKVGLNHVSYEVEDIDDLMLGHQFLANKDKYEHMWGVGRHNLGAQVFDYWADPWRHVHEHWTDTDLLNFASGSNLISIQDGLKSLWGDRSPPKFRDFAVP
jgi:catechol 2,3-dioxygenase-like lactoylglutathione lyase family enzyme